MATKKTAKKVAKKPAKKNPLPKLKFVVDRATWFRGKETNDGYSGGALCTHKPSRFDSVPENKQCCLGFFAEQLGGFSKRSLKSGDFSTLNDLVAVLKKRKKKVPEPIQRIIDFGERKFIDTNDAYSFTGLARERRLKKLFAKVNVNVKFIN